MLVKMRTHYAGPFGTASAGTVIEVDDAEAWRLIAGRYADSLDGALPPVETADAPPLETTMLARRGKRR